MVAPRSPLCALVLAALALCSAPGAVDAQSTARLRMDENVRGVPNGEVLARMDAGTSLAVTGRQDRWLRVAIEGWVWSRSLQTTRQSGFDLVVSAAQGENLRAGPSGAILGRLGRGTFLEEVEREPGWIRVRREAWIWSASVEESAPAPASTAGRPQPAAGTAPAGSTTPPAQRPGGVTPAGSQGAAILAAPGGDTLARAAAGADLEVLSREGSWARVRVEGWAWLPPRDTAAARSPGNAAALTPADLSANPASNRGRMVSWDLQFISLERAEKVRTDFFEGEPFLLTRFGGSDGPFVYVAVPADRVPELEGLVPLERLRVTGRVRTAASSLTGTPIIDLVALERVRTPE